jgi:hypothetical protein
MHQPRYPTQEQLKALQRAAQLPAAVVRRLAKGELTLDLPPNGLAVIEVK